MGFRVLPFRSERLSGESILDSRASSPSHPMPQGRILIVDDNESNRDMLSRRLQHEGYNVCVAVSGNEALTLLGTQAVDLVLLDVMMPEMDGCEVLLKLKGDGRWRDLPERRVDVERPERQRVDAAV